MKRTPLTAALCLPLALTACTTYQADDRATLLPVPHTTNAAADSAIFSHLNALEGEWEMQDEDGNWNTAAIFAVSSNGSVVREIMFPGSPSEMTNLYHMDGSEAVVTHYCAAGNQPRMTASGLQTTADGPAIDYTFDSVSNLRDSHDHVMGGLKLVFIDANNLQEHWTTLDKNGEVAGEMTFDMRRKP